MDHPLIQNVHLLELFLSGALSCQLCHRALKQTAKFHDPTQGILSQINIGDGTLHQIANVRLLDERAVSAAGFDQSLGGERLQGLPDRDAADLKNAGKFMLGGQALSRLPTPFQQLLLELLFNLRRKTHAAYGLEVHLPPPLLQRSTGMTADLVQS